MYIPGRVEQTRDARPRCLPDQGNVRNQSRISGSAFIKFCGSGSAYDQSDPHHCSLLFAHYSTLCKHSLTLLSFLSPLIFLFLFYYFFICLSCSVILPTSICLLCLFLSLSASLSVFNSLAISLLPTITLSLSLLLMYRIGCCSNLPNLLQTQKAAAVLYLCLTLSLSLLLYLDLDYIS